MWSGAELRARREALGLTQAELADRLGVARVTVARWELGLVPITRRTDAQLTAVLGEAPRQPQRGSRPGRGHRRHDNDL